MTDSGALATRLLGAALNAGLGASQFDELLSGEIADVADDAAGASFSSAGATPQPLRVHGI